MKAKNIVPIVVGGILSTGAAVAAYCEIRHLKKVIVSQDKVIECYKDESAAAQKTIEAYVKTVEAKNVAIEKTQEYVAALKQSVETRDEVIALQERQIAALQGKHESVDLPEPDSSPSPPSEETSPEPPQPRKPRIAHQEYVFQYDLDFNVVGKHASLADATRVVGLKDPKAISKVLRGRNHTAGGYFWSKGSRPLKKFPEKWIEVSKNMKKWR